MRKSIAITFALTLGLLNSCAATQTPEPQEIKPSPVAEAPAQPKEPDPQNADELYAYAEALERQGQEEKAIGYYVQATQVSPDHLKSHLALAQLYTKFNRMEEAKIAYESILRLDREHPFVAQYKEARLKYYSALNIAQNEEYDKALQLLNQAPRNTPLDKEIDEVTQKWKAILDAKAQTRKSDDLLQQASLLAYKGKYKEAIALLQTAPDANSNPALIARLEQWKKALEAQQQNLQPIGPAPGSTLTPVIPPAANLRFVSADQVNIRQSPYLYADSLGVLKRGTQVEVLMDKAYESDGYQWSKVKTMDGKVGWVAASLLVTSLNPTPATPSTPVQTQSPPAMVVGEREIKTDHVNIRRSPTLHGTLVTQAMKGTRVQILQGAPIQADGKQWIHVRLPSGQEGWVAAELLANPTQVTPPPVKTDAVSAPVSPRSSKGSHAANTQVAIKGTNINVRSQPTTGARVVAQISAPSRVTLLPAKPVTQGGYTWRAVKLDNGTQGWVVSQFLETAQGAAVSRRNSSVSERRRYIRGDKVNIRQDASPQSRIISVLGEGTPVTLMSDRLIQSQGYTWAKVRLPNGEIGWVASQFIGR